MTGKATILHAASECSDNALAAFQTWKPIEEILTFGVWKQKKVGYNEEDDQRDLTPRIVEQSDSSKSEKPLKPQPIMIHLSPLDIFRGREKQNATST